MRIIYTTWSNKSGHVKYVHYTCFTSSNHWAAFREECHPVRWHILISSEAQLRRAPSQLSPKKGITCKARPEPATARLYTRITPPSPTPGCPALPLLPHAQSQSHGHERPPHARQLARRRVRGRCGPHVPAPGPCSPPRCRPPHRQPRAFVACGPSSAPAAQSPTQAPTAQTPPLPSPARD